MKTKTYKIQLTYSCNQKWTDLTGKNERKHCLTCHKNVTDISTKSDQEIIQLLQSGGQCVRLNKSQLEKEYHFTEIQKPSFPLAKTMALISVSLLGVNAAASSDFTIKSNHQKAQQSYHFNLEEQATTHQDSTQLQIKGKVVDKETKEPLPYALIKIVDTDLECTSNVDGNFEIIAPGRVIQDPFQIKIEIIGYETVVYQFNKKDLNNGPVNIEMVWKFDMLMGDVIIIEDKKIVKNNG